MSCFRICQFGVFLLSALALGAETPGRKEAGQEWRRFLGGDGLGVALSGAYPTSWDVATGKGILWKVKVPLPGVSSPIVWQQRIFLTGATATKREMYCFDAKTGALLWSREANADGATAAAPKVSKETTYAAPTPVTDGNRVYAIFANGDVLAFDLEGKRIWARNLGVPFNPYGHASSLAMCKNMILVQLDPASEEEEGSKIVALDSQSGATAWEVRRPVEASWATPIVMETRLGPRIVTSSDRWIIAHEPQDGRIVWQVECYGSEVTASPIHAGGLVIAALASDQVYAIRPDGSGDVTKTHVAWTFEDIVPDVPTPVARGDLGFFLESSGYLGCCDLKKGKLLWEQEFDDRFYSSPVIAGDRLYLVSRKGNVFVIKADRKFEEIGRAKLGEPCDTSPAFCNGRIYIRGAKHLFAIGHGK